MWRYIREFVWKWVQGNDRLVEFEDSLLLIVDAPQLAHNLQSKLKQLMDVESAVVYVADAGPSWASGSFRPVNSGDEDPDGLPNISADSKTANWFRVNRTILYLDPSNMVTQYLRDELQAFLDQGIGLAFPMTSMDRLIGLVFLRLGRTPVSRSQLANLQVLSRQAALAFENAMLFRDRLRRSEGMVRAEQLATMGQFAAGIAHELRNPLTAIRSTVQFLADEFAEGSDQKKLANTILDDVDRLNGIVGDLLSLARPVQSRPVWVDPRCEIDKCTAFIEARARSQSVQLEVVCAEQLPKLLIDPAELRQVLLNILMNSLQAMPNGGTLCLKVQSSDQTARSAISRGDKILIEIADQGPGIPMALREKVFEPFFTTKPGGTGLGLPICRSIVRRYNGEIWIEETETGGTSVKILLGYK